jgi:hypothetical protein
MTWARACIRHAALAGLALTLSAGPAAARGPAEYLGKPNDWFAGPQARRIAANILSYQSDRGGWPTEYRAGKASLHCWTGV